MKIAIPDDYQDALRHLSCFSKLAGHEVLTITESIKDAGQLAERLQDAEALVLIRDRTRISEDLLSRLPKLRVIVQTGKRATHIDMEACTRHGVGVILSAPGRPELSSRATAELTWALVQSAIRFIPQQMTALKAGEWQGAPLGRNLFGRTLGIYGYGKIGKIVAGYGRAFGMRVLVWGREGSLKNAAADGYEIAASKEALFETADVLSLHIAMLPETRGIVTAKDLALMKPGAVLVNSSRAALIAPGVLEVALRAGRPGFAAVDVYENEPITIDHPLLNMENVICTPHLGFVEKDTYEGFFTAVFDDLLDFIAGDTHEVVNL